jgi:competence protein ComEC
MPSRSLGHRAPLLWLVVPFVAGLALGRAAEIGGVAAPLGVALGAAAVAWWAAWRAPRVWAPAIAVAMVAGGIAVNARARFRVPAWDELPPREARLALRVDRVFAPGAERRATGLATILRAEGPFGELAGQRLYFSVTLRKQEAPPIRSAVVSCVGVLVALPRHPPVNSFDGFLAGAGMNFRLTRGRVLAEEKPALGYYRFCARAAERFKAILRLGIGEKRPALAGLLRAMMLGETHELSEEQHTLFMQSGTMHLFAISGLNIAVIAGAIQAVLLLLRVPAAARFAMGLVLLWLFVDITGASPSAVRAFAMAAFLQAALVLRQPANPLAALVGSGLVVLLVAPLQLFSASFLMSYAIVAALLVLGLPLGDAWLERWSPWRALPQATWRWWQHLLAGAWRALVSALAIGLATTLVSLLTGVEFFGLLTPGALLANLLLIPAAGIATLGGFGAVVCGLAGCTWGAALCNHAAALVLWGIEGLVRLSVQLPGAFVPAHYVAPWIGSAALSALLATLVFGYATQWRRARGGWWPPFAVVALTLAFGVSFA